MTTVKRTERGWAGHFICAQRCLFRRNTLLEAAEIRVVVSTVGLMQDNDDGFREIGCNRYYETMAFHALREQDRYWDADVSRQVSFDSNWAIDNLDADDKANDMHEAVVDELTKKLETSGEL